MGGRCGIYSPVAKRNTKKSGERAAPAVNDDDGAGGKIPVNVELDPDVNDAVEQWAASEGRSKRNLMAVLTRKLVRLRKSKPEELQRLGLMEEGA